MSRAFLRRVLSFHRGEDYDPAAQIRREGPFLIAGGLFLVLCAHPASRAQEKHSPRTAGVDDTKMGPYRALAQLARRVISKRRQRNRRGTRPHSRANLG